MQVGLLLDLIIVVEFLDHVAVAVVVLCLSRLAHSVRQILRIIQIL